MRVLHLSDIHFRSPACLTPHLDPDKPFRTRLEQDLEVLCIDGIRVDVILVGGDIAYKADPAEYEVAKAWLVRIAEICGCPRDRIFTVPGNHDVNRQSCGSVLVTNAQEAIARADGFHARDSALTRQLGDERAAAPLFEPLMAYNDFAAQFKCNVFHSRPFWIHTLDFEQGVTLRIYGLTSTFISGGGDRDAAPGQLFLGSSQTALNPDPNVVALVLSHHPPSWFSDASEAGNTIDARAKLQFYGHEHDQRCVRSPELMRFLAGAVNPERDAQAWRPGYNLVDLKIVGTGPQRTLDIQARLRHFQPAPYEQFVPLLTQSQEAVWQWVIKLPQPLKPTFAPEPPLRVTSESLQHPPQAETRMAAAAHTAVEGSAERHLPTAQSGEFKVSEPSTDDLVFRFWQLRANEMRDIALSLGLITKPDLDLAPPQRYYKALEVAKERGLLVELARAVEKHEGNI